MVRRAATRHTRSLTLLPSPQIRIFACLRRSIYALAATTSTRAPRDPEDDQHDQQLRKISREARYAAIGA